MFERLKAFPPRLKGLFFIIIIFVSGLMGYTFGTLQSLKTEKEGMLIVTDEDRTRGNAGEDVDFSLYWDVWDALKQGYYQEADDIDLFYGSLQGLVQGLGDPYSSFLTPVEANEFSEELSGNFQGIGAEIGIREKQLTIIAPLPGTPAERAGLRAGDAIFAIDGLDASLLSIDEAVRFIRGEKGTEVVLTVLSMNERLPRDVVVVRDEIHVNSVTKEYDQESDTYYIGVNNFNLDTTDLFRDASLEALSLGPAGIIVDLRNNPGGFLDTAVKVAGYWTGDSVVVREVGSAQGVNTYEAGIEPILEGIPTVILLNGGSASASEIVAGALQDYGHATVIGEQSFGKGTVQILEELRGGSAIKYTVAEWLTPHDRSIEEEGITPDIIVELTEEDFLAGKDPQLERARALF